MNYFISAEKTKIILKKVKRVTEDKHNKYHCAILKELYAFRKENDPFYFFKRVVLMDIQSRPKNLTKCEILRIFEDIDEKFENFDWKCYKDSHKKLINSLYEKLLSINQIGYKLAYLIVKNFILFGNTILLLGISRNSLLPYLKAPIDIHVKNLLCYRLQLVLKDKYNSLKSDNKKFQKELSTLCENEKGLFPIDLDYLWYIGFKYCNRRVFCNYCPIKKECLDKNFEHETKTSKIENKRKKEEIDYVKNDSHNHFT